MDSPASPPTFLSVPERSAKPRRRGLTHVLDKGLTLHHVEAVLESTAPIIDIWKFGWGTAYLDRQLPGKLVALEAAHVMACTGGTLLEIAWTQGRTDDFFDWVVDAGIGCVEVSNGASGLPVAAKHELMADAIERGLTVLSEVGSKDPANALGPDRWISEIDGDIRAGASWVVAEGRESGTVGLYTPQGDVRDDIVDAIEASVDTSRVIYEAPRREQQADLIRRVGATVNLGNVAVDDVLGVETLRLGLRVDTMGAALGAELLES